MDQGNKDARIGVADLSRAHGLACGIASVAATKDDARHLQRAVGLEDCRLPQAALGLLLQQARASLSAADCQFSPQIPGDEVSLGTRARALGAWCLGYLDGYALGADAAAGAAAPPASAELLTDLARIGAELVDAEIGDDEAEERDFFEVNEYVRVAVMNLFLDRSAVSSGQR